jgi:septal ring factor EnvC (AmiA/AmiB activator)
MSKCPSCNNEFLQPFLCITCGAQTLHDHTITTLHKELAAANTRADMLQQEKRILVKQRERANEAIRRLQYMHAAHSDSVKWYRDAIAQALKSLDALPDKLSFDEAMKNG